MRDTETDDWNADTHAAPGGRAPGRARSRADAAEAMIAMDLPVDDWEVMKAEIMAPARPREFGIRVDRSDG